MRPRKPERKKKERREWKEGIERKKERKKEGVCFLMQNDSDFKMITLTLIFFIFESLLWFLLSFYFFFGFSFYFCFVLFFLAVFSSNGLRNPSTLIFDPATMKPEECHQSTSIYHYLQKKSFFHCCWSLDEGCNGKRKREKKWKKKKKFKPKKRTAIFITFDSPLRLKGILWEREQVGTYWKREQESMAGKKKRTKQSANQTICTFFLFLSSFFFFLAGKREQVSELIAIVITTEEEVRIF